jgi:hypothetical protein
MHDDRRIHRWVFGLLAVVGCGPVGPATPQADAGGSSGGGGGPTTGGEVPVTTGGVVGTTGSTGVSSDGTGAPGDPSTTEVNSSAIFAGVTDQGGDVPCDPWAQDCPPGEKCAPYANDGGGSWNALKCVPVMENPAGVGEPCFVVGNGVSGIDNCELGAFCWDVDEQNNGVCVAQCIGSPEAPTCPDPEKTFCALTGDGVLSLCLAYCDPLAQDCQNEGDACIGNPSGDGFLCVLDASGEEGQAHDPCEYANACDPGLICLIATAATECYEMAPGCCEPFCDLTEPNTCPGAGQLCNSYYEEGTAPPGQEHVGYCALPI